MKPAPIESPTKDVRDPSALGRVSDSTDQGHIVVGASYRLGSRFSRPNLAAPFLLLFVMLCTGSVAAQESGQADPGGMTIREQTLTVQISADLAGNSVEIVASHT
jgi:hypothetical protein